MNRFLLLTFLSLPTFVLAQAPGIMWQKNYGGSDLDEIHFVRQTPDLGFIAIGNTKSNDNDLAGQNHLQPNNTTSSDAWVIKTDASGTMLWNKTYGGNEDEFPNCIEHTGDGGYIFAGYSYSDVNGAVNHGYTDAWIVKLEANGDVLWNKLFGGLGEDKATAVHQTSDGGYIVCGSTGSLDGDLAGSIGGLQDYWIIKLLPNGEIDWQKRLGEDLSESAVSIRETLDGGYVFAGTTNVESTGEGDNGNHLNYSATRLTANGDVQWTYQFGGLGNDIAYDIIQLNDTEYAIAGLSRSSDIPGHIDRFDGWIVKFNDSGTELWQKSVGGIGEDSINGMIKDSDGNLVTVGHTKSVEVPDFHGSLPDAWLVKLDAANGETIWEKAYGGTSSDFGFGIDLCTDGTLVMAGGVGSSVNNALQMFGSLDFWLVKLLPETLATSQFSIGKMMIYPNPTTGKISIILPNGSGLQQVSVIDMLGRCVLRGYQPDLDLQNLNAGTYILNATNTDGTSFTVKLLKK